LTTPRTAVFDYLCCLSVIFSWFPPGICDDFVLRQKANLLNKVKCLCLTPTNQSGSLMKSASVVIPIARLAAQLTAAHPTEQVSFDAQ
jgi:hypothetical protein